MNIKFGFGVFLNAMGEIVGMGTIEEEPEKNTGDDIPFDVMLEKLKELDRKPDPDVLRQAAMFWGEDAQLFSEKMAARQNEVVRAMENESARQAMKRRKLLYSEGGFPDSIMPEGKIS